MYMIHIFSYHFKSLRIRPKKKKDFYYLFLMNKRLKN